MKIRYLPRVGFLASVLLFILPSLSTAQITFERTYGGSDTDGGRFAQQTSDGGYIIAGYTKSFGAGDYDVYLVKTDSLGDTLWTRTCGGPYDEFIVSAQQTTDDGYIVVGQTLVSGTTLYAYLLKTDSLGYVMWEKTPRIGRGRCVCQTSDGGYVVAGSCPGVSDSYDIYLFKTDSLGNLIWEKTYGDTLWQWGSSVQQTLDGGYIVAGYSAHETGGSDAYMMKTDASGESLWTRRYRRGLGSSGECVRQTSDLGCVVTGTAAEGMLPKVFLVRTDSFGDSLWTRTYGRLENQSAGRYVEQTADGGYIIAGDTRHQAEDHQDVYLIKTDSLGDYSWARTYGGIRHDNVYSVQKTTDGGYILGGLTASLGAGGFDCYLIKTDGDGLVDRDVGVVTIDLPGDTVFTDSLCSVFASVTNFGPGLPSFDVVATVGFYGDRVRVRYLLQDSVLQVRLDNWRVPPFDSTTYVMTVCTAALGDVDTTNDCVQKEIFAYNPVGIEERLSRPSAVDFRLWQTEPNPFHHSTLISYSLPAITQVTLAIYDISGRLVETLVNETQQPGIHQVRWNRAFNPSGVYFYSLKAGGSVETRKMVVVE